ncbi:MAG: aminomethyl-transferring glycine dehydrogenase subunit GcvPA [Erysipelotrichaceae bacterium]|nr:aminomethyl-transferring glycine dehydrogenase subunit GcvPA [Erysipelotrichaceae bacterium]
MGRYVISSPDQQKEMLKEIGLKSLDDLYSAVPEAARLKQLNLPEGRSELETGRMMKAMAAANRKYDRIFRGAGAYDHYIPAVVRSVTTKEQFVTTYTPYQAEISQGVLQSIFEYQTQICELTGLDVSNASVYDGAVAIAEAIFMVQERKKSTILMSENLNPQYIAVARTYCESRNVEIRMLKNENGRTSLEDLSQQISEETAAVVVQSPNYYGIIEDVEQLAQKAHEFKARLILSVNPIALGLLKSAGEMDVDICVGEGQPLGMPLSFGGPYLGFMACKKELMRKLPGRIVGQTVDHDGRRCYVLTLQAREQHIRREKASSNICSNEALCAMTASVYLAAVGPDGLRQVAENSASHAHYLQKKLAEAGYGLVYDQPFFHEFLTECPKAHEVEEKLAEKGILSGLPIGEDRMLWCATELNSKSDIDELVELVKEVG